MFAQDGYSEKLEQRFQKEISCHLGCASTDRFESNFEISSQKITVVDYCDLTMIELLKKCAESYVYCNEVALAVGRGLLFINDRIVERYHSGELQEYEFDVADTMDDNYISEFRHFCDEFEAKMKANDTVINLLTEFDEIFERVESFIDSVSVYEDACFNAKIIELGRKFSTIILGKNIQNPRAPIAV